MLKKLAPLGKSALAVQEAAKEAEAELPSSKGNAEGAPTKGKGPGAGAGPGPRGGKPPTGGFGAALPVPSAKKTFRESAPAVVRK